jgi:predicted nucleotidyltransferase
LNRSLVEIIEINLMGSVMKSDDILAVLREFMREHAEEYGILEIGIFGSTAWDEAGEQSDVDIFVRTRTPNPFALVHVKAAIEQRIHKRVDIIRMREKMNPFLKERIEKEARYV